ncbi:MAG: hypothetical protein HOO91_06250 [Bacteroidales bacterium]|nr:hypothetical protein [Bacteroidales bacterium]
MKYLSVVLVVLLSFGFLNVRAQSDCLKGFKANRVFTNEVEFKKWLSAYKNDTVAVLECLKSSVSDSIVVDDFTGCIWVLKGLSTSQSSAKVKKAAIKLLLTLSRSKISSLSTLSINSSKSYPSKCFDDSDLDSISSLIIKNRAVYKESVELAGGIGDPRFISVIQQVFPNSRDFSKPERWASYKALARLGDKDALDYCIQRVSSLPLNDQVVDVLYPDLIYIGKKEAFDLMIKALNSDETLCSSSNPNSDSKIVCGYRIMELLAHAIKDFPVKVLPSGDLDSKDYKKTLQDVRAWFNKRGDNYEILNDF